MKCYDFLMSRRQIRKKKDSKMQSYLLVSFKSNLKNQINFIAKFEVKLPTFLICL